MLKKTFAIIAVAFVAVFTAPLAANAAGYVPSSSVTVSGSVTPGGTVTVSFASGSFAANESVGFSVTGNGTATLSMFRAATVTTTKVASATGAVSVNVTLPANASGTYTLTATGVTSGNIGTASLTVVPADAGRSLARTGSTLPMLLIWTAGGAGVLGIALFVVLGLVRRQRAHS